MTILDLIATWCKSEPLPEHNLEPEQIAALKYIYVLTIFPTTEDIEQETGCNSLALGDLLFKNLIRPVFGNEWILTEAGMREAKR